MRGCLYFWRTKRYGEGQTTIITVKIVI